VTVTSSLVHPAGKLDVALGDSKCQVDHSPAPSIAWRDEEPIRRPQAAKVPQGAFALDDDVWRSVGRFTNRTYAESRLLVICSNGNVCATRTRPFRREEQHDAARQDYDPLGDDVRGATSGRLTGANQSASATSCEGVGALTRTLTRSSTRRGQACPRQRNPREPRWRFQKTTLWTWVFVRPDGSTSVAHTNVRLGELVPCANPSIRPKRNRPMRVKDRRALLAGCDPNARVFDRRRAV